ncbi:hypothetical protein AMTR_s00034p00231310 [Amborella trichopoda]|uniref:Uncharacterized protein n=1 Tax=Amborella trichopoda TaxID=13333 RepID=W1PXT5_AMBTC|nr:hypothetical protein AMTR_s00034p00231310 [Amborella trichopoda]
MLSLTNISWVRVKESEYKSSWSSGGQLREGCDPLGNRRPNSRAPMRRGRLLMSPTWYNCIGHLLNHGPHLTQSNKAPAQAIRT